MAQKKDDRSSTPRLRLEEQAVLRRRVANVPMEPGVYRWLDAKKNVLYVGKAKNLRLRMAHYVQSGVKRSAWTEIMCRQIVDFETTVVRNELEAFIVESNLIKQLRPKYNVLLKDDKGYVYVRISVQETYPRIDIVRQLVSDGAKYFGPFLGARSTHQTLDMLDSILHFRSCKKSLDLLNAAKPQSGSPCLDYQIGRCSGLCVGVVSLEAYKERISEVQRFFKGNVVPVKKRATEQMRQLASDKKFEKAARFRDVVRFIEDLEKRQIVSGTSGDNSDVFGMALAHGKIQVVLLRERDGKLVEQLAFALRGEAESPAEAMAQFLPQYYEDTQDLPDSIILSEEVPEAELLAMWLSQRLGKAVKILLPARGKKSKLLEMAERNAEEKVQQQFAAWEAEIRTVEGALAELAALVRLPAPPRRIEGYDISHLGGTATVGSMVVFVNGKPKREHYRSFHMKTVQEGAIDDYKSIKETLRRRLRYLTDDLKTSIARFSKDGIAVCKAKKNEQNIIEEISKKHPQDIGSDAVSYKDYVVARKEGEIVGFCRSFLFGGSVPMIRSLWVKQDYRGTRIGHVLIRLLLSKVKKGKVYLHCGKESLVEYYAEIGFQIVHEPPALLIRKLRDWESLHPGTSPGLILVYIASKQKPDTSFSERPDLLLIDGGKGQLSSAQEVLDALGLNIPVVGLAKREEEIFLPGESASLIVPKDSPARFLLQRVRDEAHRFANARREKRLDLAMTHSKLDEIPGIGESTRSALLKRFGSADAAISSPDSELANILTRAQLLELRKRFPRKIS